MAFLAKHLYGSEIPENGRLGVKVGVAPGSKAQIHHLSITNLINSFPHIFGIPGVPTKF